MKTKRNPFHLFATTTLVMAFSAVSSQAASQTWTNSASDLQWNASSTNWTGVAWTNNNDAVFGATGVGSIAVASGVIVNDITFDTAGYTLTGSLMLANDQDSTFTLNADETISAVIANNTAGASALTKAGVSNLTLSGNNTYTGVTTISAGTLQLGAGGTTGTLGAGNIVNNAALAFNYGATGNVSYANAISGTGSVSIAGTSGARVKLSGTNTYSGTTTINAGNALEGNAAAAYSANSDYTVNGVLESYTGSGGFSITIGALNGSGTVYNTGSGANQTTTFAVGANGHSGSFSGGIANGAWGSQKTALTKTGAGTQTLSGTSTYSGGTRANAGTLIISGSIVNAGSFVSVNNVGAQNATLKVAPGATFGVNDFLVGEATSSRGAVFQSGGDITVNNNGNGAFRVGSGASSYGYYNMSGGTLTLAGAAGEFGVGSIGQNATLGVMDVTGGTISTKSWILVGRGNTTSSGLLNVTGGSVTSTSNNIALNFAPSSGAISILNVGGGVGTAAVTGASNAGNGLSLSDYSSVAGTTGVANLLTNGTLTVGKVYAYSAATALLNFNGGTLKATATNAGGGFLTDANIDAVTVYNGGGTIHNNGTGITVSKVLAGATGNGVTSIAVTSKGSGYIGAPLVTITGGTGNLASGYAVMEDDETGNGTFRVASIIITSPGTYTVDPTTVTLTGGGAGTAATIGSITTAANTSGGMTFSGSGTTTLSSVNTYTGPTILSGGTLKLTGSISDSPMMIGAATLVGNGSVGAVTVNNASAVITNGNANTDTLTLGSLAFSTGATLNLSKVNDTDTPAISVTGNLSSASGITVNLTTAPTWSPGAYNLIGYGSFTGDASDFVKGTVPGLGGRQSATPGSTGAGAGYITLIIDGDTPVWTGDGSQTWTTVATDNNDGPNAWALKTEHTATNFWANDTVEFNDTYNLGSGDVVVTNSTVTIHGGVTPASTAFNNFDVNYTVNSDDSTGITSGALSKTGYGTVTLTTTNSYTGATTISAGTLELGNGTTDGDIATSSNIANNGTLIWNRSSGSFTYGNVISGFGGVIKNGDGTQILTGANTRSGSTTINYGTLQVGIAGLTGSLGSGTVTNNASLVFNRSNGVAQGTDFGAIAGTGSVTQAGSGTLTLSFYNNYSGGTTVNSGTTVAASGGNAFGTGAVTVNGGTITNAGDAGVGVGNAIIVAAGGTAIGIAANQDFSFYGTLSGAGNVNIASTAFVKSLNWDFSANTMTSGTITMAAGGNNTTVLRFNNPNATSAALDWVLNGAADRGIPIGAAGTYHFGSLAGSGILQGNFQPGSTLVTLSLGGNDHSADFAGSIRNNGPTVSVTKVGAGTQTLSGTNTYTGATTVNAGTLALASTGAIAATSPVSVAAGAVFDTSAKASFALAATQPVTFVVNGSGAGSSGRIHAGALDITTAAVSFTEIGTLDDAAYVIADYTGLSGTTFATVTPPTGYTINYAYNGGTQIALIKNAGYTSWADANGATGQTMDMDHDNDGVDNGIEYFMGETLFTFTANPALESGTVTWRMSATYTGVYGTDYEVQYSTNLVTWTQVPEGTDPNTVIVTAGTSVVYDMPTGGKSFVRLVVKN